jgi:hypothetical protein
VLIPAGYVTTVGLRAEPGPHRLCPGPGRDPNHPAVARPPLLAGLPRRARQGRRPAAHCLRLRSRLETPHPAARLRPAVGCRGRNFPGLGTRLSRAVRLCDRLLVSGTS